MLSIKYFLKYFIFNITYPFIRKNQESDKVPNKVFKIVKNRIKYFKKLSHSKKGEQPMENKEGFKFIQQLKLEARNHLPKNEGVNMTQVCTICNHPERLQIDRMIVKGKSHQKIAREFGVDSQAVRRHGENHLSHQLVKAYEQKDMAENMDLLNRIDKILYKAENIFDRNYEQRKDGLALKALSEQRQTIELLAKISYALHQVQALKSQETSEQRMWREHAEGQETAQLICDRLNRSERKLLDKLHKKLEGDLPYDYDITLEFRVDNEDEMLFSIESEAKQGAPESALYEKKFIENDDTEKPIKKMRRTKPPAWKTKGKVKDPEEAADRTKPFRPNIPEACPKKRFSR